jgi:hypothetical protein
MPRRALIILAIPVLGDKSGFDGPNIARTSKSPQFYFKIRPFFRCSANKKHSERALSVRVKKQKETALSAVSP